MYCKETSAKTLPAVRRRSIITRQRRDPAVVMPGLFKGDPGIIHPAAVFCLVNAHMFSPIAANL
jgi:hypothetical protein